MPTKHKGQGIAFDELTLAFDAVDTSAWTATAHVGAANDMGAISPDETGKKAYRIKWPGINSGGSATVVFSVQTDDNAGFSTPVTIETSRTMNYNASEPGPSDYLMPIPAEHERYIRLVATVATAALTGGAITAGIVPLP